MSFKPPDQRDLNKISRDFSKSNYQGGGAVDRGGCLTAFLVVFIGLNAIVLLRYFIAATSQGADSLIYIIAAGIQAVVVACAVGMWNWKRWGLIGVYVFLLFSLGIQLLAGDMTGVVGGAIYLGVVYYLTNERWRDFE